MHRMFESADQKKTQKFITNIVIEINFMGSTGKIDDLNWLNSFLKNVK